MPPTTTSSSMSRNDITGGFFPRTLFAVMGMIGPESSGRGVSFQGAPHEQEPYSARRLPLRTDEFRQRSPLTRGHISTAVAQDSATCWSLDLGPGGVDLVRNADVRERHHAGSSRPGVSNVGKTGRETPRCACVDRVLDGNNQGWKVALSRPHGRTWEGRSLLPWGSPALTSIHRRTDCLDAVACEFQEGRALRVRSLSGIVVVAYPKRAARCGVLLGEDVWDRRFPCVGRWRRVSPSWCMRAPELHPGPRSLVAQARKQLEAGSSRRGQSFPRRVDILPRASACLNGAGLPSAPVPRELTCNL